MKTLIENLPISSNLSYGATDVIIEHYWRTKRDENNNDVTKKKGKITLYRHQQSVLRISCYLSDQDSQMDYFKVTFGKRAIIDLYNKIMEIEKQIDFIEFED